MCNKKKFKSHFVDGNRLVLRTTAKTIGWDIKIGVRASFFEIWRNGIFLWLLTNFCHFFISGVFCNGTLIFVMMAVFCQTTAKWADYPCFLFFWGNKLQFSMMDIIVIWIDYKTTCPTYLWKNPISAYKNSRFACRNSYSSLFK